MPKESVIDWAGMRWPGGTVVGDASSHQGKEALLKDIAALAGPPRDRGEVHAVICREANHTRTTPEQVYLCPDRGVLGDRWIEGNARLDMQVAIMRSDIAYLFAGGQHPAFFGDNLLVDLDLSVDNLPPGSQLKVGESRCVVSEEPHTACNQFAARFGMAAMRLTADRKGKGQRLRGVYLTVIEAGEVSRDSVISVLSRP